MVKEEVVGNRVVFYCDIWECAMEGYLGMMFEEAVSHVEGHIRENVSANRST